MKKSISKHIHAVVSKPKKENTAIGVRYYDEQLDKNFILGSIKNAEIRKYLNLAGSPTLKSLITEDSWSLHLIVTNQKKQIGYIKVTFQSRSCHAYIADIFVIEAYRNLGAAKRLILEAERYALKSWNVRGFYGFTVSNNQMDYVFEGCGYKRAGTYKDFIFQNGRWESQTLWNKFI